MTCRCGHPAGTKSKMKANVKAICESRDIGDIGPWELVSQGLGSRRTFGRSHVAYQHEVVLLVIGKSHDVTWAISSLTGEIVLAAGRLQVAPESPEGTFTTDQKDYLSTGVQFDKAKQAADEALACLDPNTPLGRVPNDALRGLVGYTDGACNEFKFYDIGANGKPHLTTLRKGLENDLPLRTPQRFP